MLLSINDLEPADILLSTGKSVVSTAIRGGTMSRYSHAALYIGNGQVIESIGSGVTQQSLSSAMSDDTLVTVYRRINMRDAQAKKVIQYAKAQLGKKYDAAGAIGGGVTSASGVFIGIFLGPLVTTAAVGADLLNRHNPEAAFYCSELVAIAFEKAGVPLGSGAASTTPADISRSHVLNYIGDLKKSA
ncbi:MAG: hypothetical protein CSA09_03565 [Candidatus Contendobacter odensis]|uniref:Uncharacterized protein n=1 Tax=Candidatus Contendibacter odensensis TaxID=1400860 RepID=A0A2G6PF23_9GAMM|nr:MAG: hypothetical protein CSA09_03565 [Candidatus Contendobacter odensis]